MFEQDFSNTIFSLAADLVNHTSQPIFLTGKAGTGKTTFLKYIRDNTAKNTIVVAPTGVAAINAGGVTMHSFFQLPFGAFVPGTAQRDGSTGFMEVTDKHSLFKNIHFTSNKRQLLQEMELLIIDEVSMMRCDMLDAIDTILRHFRKLPHLPFGGVQVLYIGDLFQLPPVIPSNEWTLLQSWYESPFFFSSKVVAEAPPLYVELKKIYRQSEQQFIDVLNRIRNNVPQKQDFDFLNSRYDPNFSSAPDDHYITITTHNKRADAINAAELNKLPGKAYTFKGDIIDDFSDKALPTEVDLSLKEGAQVMFIKNDSGTERRFFNGKIATVTRIQNGEITVTFEDNSELVLEKETWENIRYVYNREKDELEEEVLGSFTQYPIRLAWAITIHKSQGLTFNKAIIDAGASFAAGQVYVALSRCSSIDGLVLRSRIYPSSIFTDQRIIAFAQKEANDDQLAEVLEREKYKHWEAALLKLFDWSKIVTGLYQWRQIIPEKKLPDIAAAMALSEQLLAKAKEQSDIAQKFRKQLSAILAKAPETDYQLLKERMEKAIGFFAEGLATQVLQPLQEHIINLQHASKITKYKEELKQLEGLIWQQLQKIVGAKYGEIGFRVAQDYDHLNPDQKPVPQKPAKKMAKGDSKRASLELFRSGKPVNEIARLRNMAISTIEGHLSQYVATGDIEVTELVSPQKIAPILEVINEVGAESMGLIKHKLGDGYTFGEVRAVMAHYRYLNKEAVE